MHRVLKYFTITKIINLLIIIVIINTILKFKFWQEDNKVICNDIIFYYSYLPATFIYGDVTLDFIGKIHEDFSNKFWPIKTPIGKNAIKTTMGMSILYAPFFFAGHLAANILNYPTDGYSPPYKFALLMSAVVYLLIGLYFLRKVLEKYFTKLVTAITLITIVLGTNLFHYSAIEAIMPHVYGFSLIAIFIYLVIKWYEKPSIFNTIIIGLLAGLIVLIRPTNILILIFLLLWDINSWKSLKERIYFFIKSYYLILIMIICFFLVWIPQFFYWKAVSGQWLYFSYSNNENFFFSNPQIINGLFSYRKGWLLYTPVMIFALIGIPILFKKNKSFFWPVTFFTILNIYILLSWWSWWYGGGFGLRAFIDSYSILAIPFAAFLKWSYEKKTYIKLIITAIIFMLIFFNLFQTKQYYFGAIHWDAMSKEAYWASFGKLHPPKNFHNLLEHPDYEKAKQGIQDIKKYDPTDIKIYCDAEKTTENGLFYIDSTGNYLLKGGEYQSQEKSYSGKYSIKLSEKNTFGMRVNIDKIKTGDHFIISVWRFGNNNASVVATAEDPKVIYKLQNIPAKKDRYGWEKLTLDFVIPEKINTNRLKIYLWNNSDTIVYFDDLKIYIYKSISLE
ncbi:MAG: hypothetical protein Kow0068_18940 [Marinilabiliales bacterium]